MFDNMNTIGNTYVSLVTILLLKHNMRISPYYTYRSAYMLASLYHASAYRSAAQCVTFISCLCSEANGATTYDFDCLSVFVTSQSVLS